jgi:DNA-binding MarR family transcriptional regulator
VTSPDLKHDSQWRALRLLLDSMNDEIAAVYAERGIEGVPPRFSMVLIRLAALGPLTIRQLADEVEVTHSAMSQTVTAMKGHGLVDAAPGADARTRLIGLTAKGRGLVPFLEAISPGR